MNRSVTLEVCVDSLESAVAAQRGGAHRIELCSALVDGGVTPSFGLIAEVRQKLTITVHVMIRPRSSDFCYSEEEFKIMQRDIAMAKELQADGVVTGMLDLDGRIDVVRTRRLVELAAPMQVTFHRAFDMSRDPFEALGDLHSTGVHYVLTSGGKQRAVDATDTLARLVKESNGRIRIMAGAGIQEHNVRELIERTGVQDIHASAKSAFDSPMRYRNEGVSMGALQGYEYQRFVAEEDKVRRLLLAARESEPLREAPADGNA